MLNYQAIRTWIEPTEEYTIILPIREMELAVVEAFDMQAYSIRGAATQMYINTGIEFLENDWFAL